MNLKNWKLFTSKFVGTGPSSYEKRIYRAAVSQRLRNTGLQQEWPAGCASEAAIYEANFKRAVKYSYINKINQFP